jgi:hypothetical protein
MPITAAQLVYANVEKDRSPHKRSGFQTLFYSQSRLSEAEVDAIEPRLFYAHGAGNPPKGLFFPLGQDKLVLARIVPVEDTDAFGRKGRYLVHALVFYRTDWIAEGLDPIALLQSFPFLTSVDQALTAGDGASGDMAPLTLTLAATSAPRRQWPVAAMQRLTLYALRAETMVRERQALAFIGPPAEVEQALAEVLMAVPAALRTACSFDSFFHEGNFIATPFWAIGLPETPPPGRFIRVDVTQRAFLDDEAPPAPRTVFERWVVARLQDLELGIEHERETAYSLCCWLEGTLPVTALPAEVPEQVLAAVFRAAPAQAEKRVYERLTHTLPAVLADIVWADVQPQRTDRERYAELRQGFAPLVLAEWLWTRLTQPGATLPAPAVQRALAEWLRRHPHPALALLSLAWDGQWQALQAELVRLEPAAYEALLLPLLRAGGVPPLRLLLPERGELFVRGWLAERFAAPLSLPELVSALLRQHEAAALAPLAPLLKELRPREQQALEQLIVPHAADIPSEFAQALSAVREEQSTGGVLAGLKRWLRP